MQYSSRMPSITAIVTPHGGHCGFVESPVDDDGYWAERTVVAFLAARVKRA